VVQATDGVGATLPMSLRDHVGVVVGVGGRIKPAA
jgi:hypothetical protein